MVDIIEMSIIFFLAMQYHPSNNRIAVVANERLSCKQRKESPLLYGSIPPFFVVAIATQ
jgi:hypothetical protein